MMPPLGDLTRRFLAPPDSRSPRSRRRRHLLPLGEPADVARRDPAWLRAARSAAGRRRRPTSCGRAAAGTDDEPRHGSRRRRIFWLPGMPVFVDSRLESYPPEFLRAVLAAQDDDAALDRLIDRSACSGCSPPHAPELRDRALGLAARGLAACLRRQRLPRRWSARRRPPRRTGARTRSICGGPNRSTSWRHRRCAGSRSRTSRLFSPRPRPRPTNPPVSRRNRSTSPAAISGAARPAAPRGRDSSAPARRTRPRSGTRETICRSRQRQQRQRQQRPDGHHRARSRRSTGRGACETRAPTRADTARRRSRDRLAAPRAFRRGRPGTGR